MTIYWVYFSNMKVGQFITISIKDVLVQLKHVYPMVLYGIDYVIEVLFVASLIEYKNLFLYLPKHASVNNYELKYRF